ncbi:radiation-inducible immediate-early gene IEX-1 isoform X1 [Strigops habroptila]|uniref:radiation-inducible immediate-early gene IEX-1 isoform X1 n=2 Tax=Strigops habroptila TaxID=2489341 RepID=UPI0011CFE737|nr:radiation-inducible immediate-early gene IEX-1 isoform X1 [Strigops habroptila]
MTVPMMAAAAATTTCPGRGWRHREGYPGAVPPSPPRHFTFEPPLGPSCPPRPRRRHRRVLYPPAVRRPPPMEEPSAAKRLLVLLLAVVSAQVYNTPGEVTPEVAPTSPGTPEAPIVPAGTPGGTLVGPPMGASCPRLLLSPILHPTNCTAAH